MNHCSARSLTHRSFHRVHHYQPLTSPVTEEAPGPSSFGRGLLHGFHGLVVVGFSGPPPLPVVQTPLCPRSPDDYRSPRDNRSSFTHRSPHCDRSINPLPLRHMLTCHHQATAHHSAPACI